MKDPEYARLLGTIVEEIKTSRHRTISVVNSELVRLYWKIGRHILERQKTEGWGSKVVDRLSADLRLAFPDARGFSSRNLKYMRKIAEELSEERIVQAPLAQLPWYHIISLLEKVPDEETRLWYALRAVEQGWSRDVMTLHIDRRLVDREGKAPTNFAKALGAPDSDLAQAVFKDPYILDFLDLDNAVRERDIERGLIAHIKDFLLELGKGFSFVGSQYRIRVGETDYFLDLLFYHLKLHCYVVIELKVDEFKPEYAGKMNFYLSAVDDKLRSNGDAPSIGMILCREKEALTVEYALRDVRKPIGVSGFELTAALPDELKSSLPTIEELELGLDASEGSS